MHILQLFFLGGSAPVSAGAASDRSAAERCHRLHGPLPYFQTVKNKTRMFHQVYEHAFNIIYLQNYLATRSQKIWGRV